MSLQITRGKKPGATRAIIYGTEGIGKSTLAAQLPGVLLIDTEDGTGQIDAARVLALDWRAIENAVKELIADSQGFRAIVIDSADWLEKALIEHMLKQAGKKSIEDYGYGKGYTMLCEHVVRFLGLIDQLIAKGIHVVFVAHAKTVRTSPPDQTDGFDRYELKLTKQVAPLLKEWADMILFTNYKIQIVEGTDGRLKAQGGKDRIMYATHSAAWDAKNRYGLADEMPMEFAQIAHVFGAPVPRPAAPVVKPTPAAAIAQAQETAPLPVMATADQLARLTELGKTPIGARFVANALEQIHGIGLDELNLEEAANLLAAIEAELKTPASASPQVPPHIADWLDANAGSVNAYMVRVNWLKAGQSWRDLGAEEIGKILEKTEKFARAAGIAALGERKAA